MIGTGFDGIVSASAGSQGHQNDQSEDRSNGTHFGVSSKVGRMGGRMRWSSERQFCRWSEARQLRVPKYVNVLLISNIVL